MNINSIQIGGIDFKIEPADHNINIWKIRHSYALRAEDAAIALWAKDVCPIFSPQRPEGELQFIVNPSENPPPESFFMQRNVRREPMSQETLSILLARMPRFSDEQTISLPCGEHYTRRRLEDLNGLRCTRPTWIALEYFHQRNPEGPVLDLGCGLGSNSLPLLRRGWKVIAVDRCREALGNFKKRTEKFSLAPEQLNLVEANIVSCPLPESSFQAVFAMDVLHCIDPRELQGLLKKIHQALLPEGRFFGSFFISGMGNAFAEETMLLSATHSYPQEFIPALLESVGFHVKNCVVCSGQWDTVLFEASKEKAAQAI